MDHGVNQYLQQVTLTEDAFSWNPNPVRDVSWTSANGLHLCKWTVAPIQVTLSHLNNVTYIHGTRLVLDQVVALTAYIHGKGFPFDQVVSLTVCGRVPLLNALASQHLTEFWHSQTRHLTDQTA